MYDQLIKSQLPIEVRAVVELTVEECVQMFMDAKKKNENEIQNPLLRLIHDLIDEVSGEECKDIVEEVITEKVDDHLMGMRCRIAHDALLDEIMATFVNNNFEDMYVDVEVDVTRENLLHECIDEIIDSFVHDIVNELQEDLLEARLSAGRKAVEDRLKESYLARELLIYFMQQMSENFHTVKFEYYAKVMVERMVATRLVGIMDDIESELGSMVKNNVIKEIVSKFFHKIMQRSLITELQHLSEGMLQDIDCKEQRKLVTELEKEGRDIRIAYQEPSFPHSFTEFPRDSDLPDTVHSTASSSSQSMDSDPVHINFQSL